MMNFILVAHAVTISTSFPGMNSGSSAASPGAWVEGFYQFALLLGGILALGAIVFGGVKYVASAGNPSSQNDAKEWIWGALIGLVLLAGAYLVLNVINPQLVNLNLPTLSSANTQAQSSQSAGGSGSQTASTCQATSNGGSSGSCPNTSGGVVQNCCNDGGSATCTTYSCSTFSDSDSDD